MQGKDFIYFLFDENNNSYYQYGDTVLSSASLKPLEFTPDGWKKIQIQNQRNGTYFAVDRSFTVPLEYVKDGGQILKHIYYNYGIEAKVYMVVCEQQLYFDATHYGYYYKLLYRGEIDLAQFKHDGAKVTVNIMEGGIVKFIKAYENTKYEIPVDVPDAVDVYMDGVEFKYNTGFITIQDSYDNVQPFGNAAHREYFMTFYNFSTEGQLVNVITQDISREIATGFNPATDERWFLKALANVNLDTHFKFSGSLTKTLGPFTMRFRILVADQNGNQLLTLFDETKGPGAIFEPVNIDVQATLNLSQDDRLFLLLILDSDNTALPMYGIFSIDESTSDLSYFSSYRPTTIKALRPAYVLQQLISKISGGAYTPQSDYLTNTINDVVITCGDAIRNIQDAVIKTSLRDFFTSYNSHFGIGMGMLGNTLRLEQKSFWVQYTDVIDLGEVSKMKVSPANDLLVNNIKIGTPEQKYDDVNGKQEFNTTSEYSTPITRVAKDLSLISVYRADCYGIEFTRLNLDGKDTTDNDSDNDVFMIHIEDTQRGDGLYHVDRSLNAGATGLLSPATIFNLYLTPARALRRNGDYIRSLFYKLDAKYLTFQTSDKNDQVVAVGITENADVQIASLPSPLFSCNYLEFETKVPLDTLELLRANPLKAFSGTWAGFSFVGIPDKVSVQPGDNGAQTFKLLASPNTNLLDLINIEG
jgi:hypothetical protein